MKKVAKTGIETGDRVSSGLTLDKQTCDPLTWLPDVTRTFQVVSAKLWQPEISVDLDAFRQKRVCYRVLPKIY